MRGRWVAGFGRRVSFCPFWFVFGTAQSVGLALEGQRILEKFLEKFLENILQKFWKILAKILEKISEKILEIPSPAAPQILEKKERSVVRVPVVPPPPKMVRVLPFSVPLGRAVSSG